MSEKFLNAHREYKRDIVDTYPAAQKKYQENLASFEKEEAEAKAFGALCYVKKPGNFDKLKSILSLVADHLATGSLRGVCNAINHLPV